MYSCKSVKEGYSQQNSGFLPCVAQTECGHVGMKLAMLKLECCQLEWNAVTLNETVTVLVNWDIHTGME